MAEQLLESQFEAKLETPFWREKRYVLLFGCMAALYFVIALVRYKLSVPGGGAHFIYLADGWLHGHLYLHSIPPDTGDYTFQNGHWYVAFPPLPAVLLLPLVAIFHLSHQTLLNYGFSVGMGVINIGLMLWVLMRFSRKRGAGLTWLWAAWLLILFALGTDYLYVTMQGSTWNEAHVVATTFLLLYAGETLGKRRPLIAGLFLGLAALARVTTLLTFPFFVLLVVEAERGKPQMMWKQLTFFFAILGLFIAGMLAYNLARFGTLFDFGYSAMNVTIWEGNLHSYGQFNPHFIPINLRYMLLDPPQLMTRFPYITFSPFGTGIFWTTPALLYAFLAFRNREHRWLALSFLAACLLPMAALLLYFNTGYYQFGYRFSLDFLPFALLLAALGMQPVLTRGAKLLILLSVLITLWGNLVFYTFPPPLAH